MIVYKKYKNKYNIGIHIFEYDTSHILSKLTPTCKIRCDKDWILHGRFVLE